VLCVCVCYVGISFAYVLCICYLYMLCGYDIWILYVYTLCLYVVWRCYFGLFFVYVMCIYVWVCSLYMCFADVIRKRDLDLLVGYVVCIC